MEKRVVERDGSKGWGSRRLRVALFIALNAAAVGLTAFFDFRPENRGASDGKLPEIHLLYLFPAFLCFALAVASETLKYRVMISGVTARAPSAHMPFTVAVLGRYYDNITPFGAGGQPFQINYLIRRGLPAGEAAAVTITGFLTCQLAFILMSVPVFIFGGGVIDTAALFAPAALGLLFYIAVPAAICLFIISPGLTGSVLSGACSLLGKLKLSKNPGALRERALDTLASSRDGIISVMRNRDAAASVFALSFLYRACICSMPFFVLRAFGSGLGYINAFCTCVFIYLCITFIPTPGNSGVAEGSFYAFFAALGQERLFWVMLIWRLFSYYLFILLGFVTVSLENAHTNKRVRSGAVAARSGERR
ncbi:MAG: flippase-like domain-containing protein [Oscillospiraceae bacterium]|jgi:uncharacterized protein (TIRG00374 family)|nr:flippase-like domain-containing protein [Oscillospiraceae bacterium]